MHGLLRKEIFLFEIELFFSNFNQILIAIQVNFEKHGFLRNMIAFDRFQCSEL